MWSAIKSSASWKKIEPVIKKSVVLLSVNTVGGVWLWQQLTHEKPNQSIFTLVVAVVVVVIVVVVVVVVVIPEWDATAAAVVGESFSACLWATSMYSSLLFFLFCWFVGIGKKCFPHNHNWRLLCVTFPKFFSFPRLLLSTSVVNWTAWRCFTWNEHHQVLCCVARSTESWSIGSARMVDETC